MAPKRKNDPGYKLPEVISPDENCCICIPIPNDFNHKMAFLGQLDELGYWWNWERDPDKKGREAAAVWREIVTCIREDMDMSGCGCGGGKGTPTNQRYTEDGHLEVSYDNGETWESGDGNDPRFNSPTFSPLPGADTSDKRCIGANSVVAVLKAEQSASSDILGLAGGFTALLASVVTAVAATGVGVVPAAVIALMGVILNKIVTGGQEVFDDSFTTPVWDELLCILFCNMENDASFSEDQWETIQAEVGAMASYPANEWLAGMIKSVGPVGLTNAARSGMLGSLSCETCSCPAGLVAQDGVPADPGTIFEVSPNVWQLTTTFRPIGGGATSDSYTVYVQKSDASCWKVVSATLISGSFVGGTFGSNCPGVQYRTWAAPMTDVIDVPAAITALNGVELFQAGWRSEAAFTIEIEIEEC